MNTVLPYKDQDSGKKEQVAQMFNNIAPRYDFLNRVLSIGIDIYWRRRAIGLLRVTKPKLMLDIATGTGDFALEAMRLKPEKVIGIDISKGMIEYGIRKVQKKNLQNTIELRIGDSEKLDFADNTFDAVTVSFGVRNFENLKQGLSEIKRVLKPNGTLIVLEFSQPESSPFKEIYNFYFKNILPKFGKVVSKDSAAYTYLPESVKSFPYGAAFIQILKELDYEKTQCIPLTFGISSIYKAQKPS